MVFSAINTTLLVWATSLNSCLRDWLPHNLTVALILCELRSEFGRFLSLFFELAPLFIASIIWFSFWPCSTYLFREFQRCLQILWSKFQFHVVPSTIFLHLMIILLCVGLADVVCITYAEICPEFSWIFHGVMFFPEIYFGNEFVFQSEDSLI